MSSQNKESLERMKRAGAELVRKNQERRKLISAPSSKSMDMGKVHAQITGPHLSYDISDPGRRKADDEEDEEGGGLVVACAQDSRAALNSRIQRVMSQHVVGLSSMRPVDDMEAIRQQKRSVLCRRREGVVVPAEETQQPVSDFLPENQVIDETVVVSPTFVNPTLISQNFTQEEEIEMEEPEPVVSVQPFSETQVLITVSQTQVVADRPVDPTIVPRTTIFRQDSTDEVMYVNLGPSMSSVPSEEDIDAFLKSKIETEHKEEENSSPSEKSLSEKSFPEKIPLKSRKRQLEFDVWLAERKRLKLKQKLVNKKRSEKSSEFVDAEAEESEDEDLGGILRGSKISEDEESEGSSSDEEDLDDLVASAEDEFNIYRKQAKDSKRVAKLHAKWAAERDEALERAIEEKDFMGRKKIKNDAIYGDSTAMDGLSRLQRKLKAQRDAYVQQFDHEGNPLAPEEVDEESDYDSMEIDSDDFFDENELFSENENENELTAEEKAARAAKKAKDLERRKRDAAFKAEMQQRRIALKEKLRLERIQREKDKREIQAGLNIMTEEDRETFKMVSRLPQSFVGVSQAPTTANTPMPAEESGFAFLGTKTVFSNTTSQRRRSSIGSLELE